MRTTLDLDEDVLSAIKHVASVTGTSAGKAASDLVRRGLAQTRVLQDRDGLLLFPEPAPGVKVTSEIVARLFDELP